MNYAQRSRSTSGRPVNWRDSLDYRNAYFRKNPGYFGFIWICSQCAKPLLGRRSVQVDHIFPPSKFSKTKKDSFGNVKSNTSFLAEAANTERNLVACCDKCNRRKSDKVGIVTAKGAIAKVFEMTTFTGQKGLVVVVGLTMKILYHLIRFLLRLLSKPLTMKGPWYLKLACVAFYAFLAYYIFSRLGKGGF
jgi:5-methylcytosine-specific restriction endonuclease McrA